MSQRADGRWYCDHCGTEIPNESIHAAAVLNNLHPTRPGESIKWHLCRVNGCAGLLLSGDLLADWKATGGMG